MIELDDQSHQRADLIAHDKFVDGVFKTVGLPILYLPVIEHIIRAICLPASRMLFIIRIELQ
ncbi:DUF2726 domain-containing protein [Klebsiella oxytoca]